MTISKVRVLAKLCIVSCITVLSAMLLVLPSQAANTQIPVPLQDAYSSFKTLFSSIGEDFQRITVGTTATSVSFPEKYKKGSIIVRTNERKLYFVTAKGHALRYAVGVGREGFTWKGVSHISRKAKWPRWTPPKEMRERQPDLPKFMPGGPKNPLGARALYLGASLYRIHGTPAKFSVGAADSSGCIRMLNNDVIDLYNRTKTGAKVYVYH